MEPKTAKPITKITGRQKTWLEIVKKISKRLAVISIAVFTLCSCTEKNKATSAEDVLEEVKEAKKELKEAKEEMKEAIATKQEFFESRRDSLLAQLNQRHERLEEKLNQLQEILQSDVSVAAADIESAYEKVKVESLKVKDRIEVLQNSTTDNWDQMSQVVDSSLIEFDRELANIEREIQLIKEIKQKN